MSLSDAFARGRTAVVTGAASGIGLAAAKAFADLGLNLVLVDLEGPALERAGAELGQGATGEIVAMACDVAEEEQVLALAEAVFERFGEVGVLMNNAATAPGGGPYDHPERWRRVLGVNLFGVLNGVQAFIPRMIASGRPGAVINTGSKQGITNPPGDAAYNVSKAGVKALTEALAFRLREETGDQICAHLLIPGFVWTGLTARARGAAAPAAKPPGAWTPEETVALMMTRLGEGAFYILCPDGETTPELDRRRMLWSVGDVIKDRPALSRWRPEYRDAFAAFLAESDEDG